MGHAHLDDLLPGEDLIGGAVKCADVEHAGGRPERGSERKPQRASRRHIEVPITPGHLQLLGGPELPVLRPDAFGYVGRSHRNARMPAVADDGNRCDGLPPRRRISLPERRGACDLGEAQCERRGQLQGAPDPRGGGVK